jgi:tetratricopeptide (TPR) repeat protein
MTDSTPKYQPPIDKSILASIGDYNTVNQYIQSQPAQPTPYMLPQDIGDFTGREDYIAQIEATLDRGKIAAIAGIPGVGKSALAIRVAYRLKERYPDAQLYVNLYGQDPRSALETKTVLIRFLTALTGRDESQLATDLEGLKGQYRSILATKQALVILDNARDEAQIMDLLPSNPKCAVVVTSRSRLTGLPGTGSIDLEPMAVGINGELGEAELLFQAILQDGNRVNAELPAAREIVNLCGRLPIAIRITAATLDRQIWARKSLQAYAKEIAESNRLSKLENENVEKAIPGQGSVRASFNLSYQGLAEEDRQLFRWAGGLPGLNFGLAVLAAAMEWEKSQIEAGLNRLLEAQVLELRGEDRFGWHDLMRLFAKEQLNDTERETVLNRGLTWYCQQANFWNNGLNPVRCRQLAQQWAAQTERSTEDLEKVLPMMAINWFARQQTNWVDVVRDLTQIPRPDEAIALAANLAPFFGVRSMWGDWVTTHEMVKDCAQQAGNLAGVAQTLVNLGIVYRNQGKWDEAIACFEQSLETKRQLEDEHGVAQTLNNLGNVYQCQSKWDEAISCYEKSLETKRRLEDEHGVAQTLVNLGIVYQYQSKWDETIACLEQSLETFRQLGDEHSVAQTLNNLGNVYQSQSKWDEAISCYDRSLETLRRLGDEHGVGITLANLAIIIHDRRNQPEQARTFWQEALTLLHPSSSEFQTVQQWLATPAKPRQVNYLLPLAIGGVILFCLVKGYWLLAIFGVGTILFCFRRSIFRRRGM